MLLPGGMLVDDREQAIDSMGGVPSTSFELSDERVLELGGEAAAVVHRATAHRGEMSYAALLHGTYVREGGAWKLALHRQTPA